MLDILRKHASSWVIKVILGAIVISFIFFFGYSSMRRQTRSGSSDVATVNGKPISMNEYKFILDNVYERLKSSFSGKEVPDFMIKMARAQTMRQLISREIGLELASKLGVVIADGELISAISMTPYAQRDGEFDPIFYRHQFLPYFKQRFGLDFERFLQQDLKLEMLESIFATVDKGVPEAKDDSDEDVELMWTFESIAFDSDKLVGDGKVKSTDEVRKAAEIIVSSDPKKWEGLTAPFGVKAVKAGPMSVRDRKRLFDGKGTVEEMTAVFSLTPDNPVLSKAIEHEGKIYVVRLVKVEEGITTKGFWPAHDFYRSWMAKLSENAKVVSYLNEEE